MCSIDQDVDMPVPKSKITTRRDLLQGRCHKCKEAPPVVDMKRVQYCRPCFIESVLYRFKLAVMRGSKEPDGAKVCIAVSGGPSSSLLLEGMKRFHAIDPTNPRKRRKFSEMIVCYIDTAAVLGHSEKAVEIEQAAKEAGFEFFRVPLESVFLNPDGSDPGVLVPQGINAQEIIQLQMIQQSTSVTPAERLQQCVHALGKATAKEEMLELLTWKVIIRLAKQEGCAVVARGDNSTRMAVNVIAQTSRGRGFGMPVEMSEHAGWYKGITIVRPLRDILAKEVAVFNRFEQIHAVLTPDFTTGMPAKASIDRLTEAFVVGLQNEFPMTVNTVVRTAAKVVTGYTDEDTTPCPLCDGPIQKSSSDWRARHTVSNLAAVKNPASTTGGVKQKEDGKSSPCSNDCACSENVTSVTVPPPSISTSCCSSTRASAKPMDISPHICYACQNLCRDVVDTAAAAAVTRRKTAAPLPTSQNSSSATSIAAPPPEQQQPAFVLPAYVAEAVVARKGRDWMKKEIGEFLIEHGED
ncbi:hypothetical protein DFJ77DRAFT_478576 [Powellomyces hirtus]|nr:hypothetical protein DFJ77DRAFT_478576 [Powellomyces hirtus]